MYRRVMCNDTKEWWKIWRGIDLSFQNWQKEFDEFGLENLKVLEIYALMGFYWPKYIIFHNARVWCKIWRKTELWFETLHEEIGRFLEHTKFSKLGLLLSFFKQSRNFQSTRKSRNWDFHWFFFKQSRKCMSLKLAGELCVMTIKNDAKFENELTCQCKIDMKNLKPVFSIFIKPLFFWPNKSSLEKMKNAFYFIEKVRFTLEIFNFFIFRLPLFFSLLLIALEDDWR